MTMGIRVVGVTLNEKDSLESFPAHDLAFHGDDAGVQLGELTYAVDAPEHAVDLRQTLVRLSQPGQRQTHFGIRPQRLHLGTLLATYVGQLDVVAQLHLEVAQLTC